jgi:hypothetical protein
VLPASDPDRLREQVAALLRPRDRLILSNAIHDVAQSVEGAAAARGDYLLFTGSHAWPEHDVLLELLAEFERNPNWAAISGRTISVAPTRLSRAESDHYDRDIHDAMTGHPWQKRIAIDCAPVRSPISKVKPAFFIDDLPVPDDRVSYCEHGAVIALQERPPGRLRLAWICAPFAARSDSRRLGLPVTRIAIT